MTEIELHAPAPQALLAIDDLHVWLGRRPQAHVVRGLSYTVAPGEVVALVGESGSGKTISALAALGLLPPGLRVRTSGSVRLEGAELLGSSERALRRIRGRRAGVVFQDPQSSLDPVLTIGAQMTEAIRAHRKLPTPAARARAVELLERVGIPAAARRLDDYPHQFSGGMRQRVLIAMALASDPVLLIADEPTTALDVTIQAQIVALLDELRREQGMALVLITHDLGLVSGFADRMVVMYSGRAVEHGAVTELLKTPRHPYTAGLLRSVPDPTRGAEPLRPIPGAPPDLAVELPGCPFAPRCERRLDACVTEMPPLVASGDRAVACLNPQP